ncbi:MAG TPA: putative toxin-antitoxin system toxin component, PIN family [Gemmataceae bacterium]|nr:putative toxin-antitoxin system toxin component, PIN family [Gemmataceae bacterium]
MSQEGKPGVVFDCVAFLQAAIRPTGPAALALRLLDAGRFVLFVSDDVLRELRDVLSRPKVQRKNPALTPEGAQIFVEWLSERSVHLNEVPRRFAYPRDPDDEPYVNLALAAEARYLVTRDTDLLDLMRQDLPTGQEFRRQFPGLTILDPAAFLRELPASREETKGPDQPAPEQEQSEADSPKAPEV